MRFFVAIAGIAMASLLATTPALAQGKEWDQKAVTALVDEFVATLGKIQVEVKTADNMRSDEAREFVVEDLALLRKNARKLSQELRTGKDRVSSWPRAKRCERLITRTRANAQQARLSPLNSQHVERANELIELIGAYYGDDPAPASS